MDLTVEYVARVIVVAACLSQLAAAVAVLIREQATSRPSPVERAGGPLALVNYVGIAGFVSVGLTVAITNVGAFRSVAQPLADGMRVVGILVLWTAGLVAIWGARSIGRHLVRPPRSGPIPSSLRPVPSRWSITRSMTRSCCSGPAARSPC